MDIKELSVGKGAIALVLSLALGIGATGAIAACSTSISTDPESQVTANPTQQDRLADGLVTFDEYRSSIEEAITCATRQGVNVSEPKIGSDGVTLNYSIYEGELGPNSIVVFDECYDELAGLVDREFQSSPEVEAARRSYLREMSICIYGSEAEAIGARGDLTTAVRIDGNVHPEYATCMMEATKYRSIVATASST